MKRLILAAAVALVASADAADGRPRPELHMRKPGEDVKYVAHQGEEMLAVNHSIAAYKLAAEHKCDYLKLDVRNTKDNVIITQHDATLDSVYGVKGVVIRKTDYADLLKYRRSRGEFPDQHVCTLDEALEIAKTMTGVWIDFKDFNRKFADRVFERIAAAGIPDERVIVGTWSKSALKYVRECHPKAMAVAHTYIRGKEGAWSTNSGDRPPDQTYATLEELADGILAKCRADDIQGLNMPSGMASTATPPWMIKKFRDAGLFVSIWFVKNPRVGKFYRDADADAFVMMCAEWTGRDVPYARPLFGVCAWCESMDDVKTAVANKAEMIGFAYGKAVSLDAVDDALKDSKSWVYCDIGWNKENALALAEKIEKSPRRSHTLLAGGYPAISEVRKAGFRKVWVCNATRRDNYNAPTNESRDRGYVDQTASSRVAGLFMSVGTNLTEEGIAYLRRSSIRTVCFGAKGPEDVKALHDAGYAFVVLPAFVLKTPTAKSTEGGGQSRATSRLRLICKQGYHGEDAPGVPGNSAEAFRLAWEKGARLIETDCWMIKGGRIILVHDPKVLKCLSGEWHPSIKDLTEEDVARIDIGRAAKSKSPVRLAHLEDLFASMPKDAVAQCELCGYTDTFADTFDSLRAKAGLSEANIVISGANRKSLADFKRRYPRYRTLWLESQFLAAKDFRAAIEKTIRLAKDAGIDVVCPRAAKAFKVGLSPADADRFRAAGLEFRVWGVNTPELLEYAMRLGVPAATCSKWREAFDWAKNIPGLEVAP